MSLYSETEIGVGGSYPRDFATTFPRDKHWQQIKKLQTSPLQKQRWKGLLYNCLLTERRHVFMLSRSGFAKVLRKAFGTRAPSGSEFAQWRQFMIDNRNFKELRPPVQTPGSHRGGLYELTDPDMLAILRRDIAPEQFEHLLQNAIAFFDNWEPPNQSDFPAKESDGYPYKPDRSSTTKQNQEKSRQEQEARSPFEVSSSEFGSGFGSTSSSERYPKDQDVPVDRPGGGEGPGPRDSSGGFARPAPVGMQRHFVVPEATAKQYREKNGGGAATTDEERLPILEQLVIPACGDGLVITPESIPSFIACFWNPAWTPKPSQQAKHRAIVAQVNRDVPAIAFHWGGWQDPSGLAAEAQIAQRASELPALDKGRRGSH